MNFLKQIFAKRTQPEGHAESTHQIGLKFFASKGESDTLDLVYKSVSAYPADRVFIIGGLTYLSNLMPSRFPGYEVLINREGTFGWLQSVCEYLQRAKTRAVLVSVFLRHWESPKVTFKRNRELGIVAEPCSAIDGIIETAAGPPGMTLCATPSNMTASFCFVQAAAMSYYQEVLRSQGCPPKTPKMCQAVIDVDNESDFDSSLRNEVLQADNFTEKEMILRQFAEDEEKRCLSLERGILRRTYTGGILRPSFSTKDKLPEGALTPQEILKRQRG